MEMKGPIAATLVVILLAGAGGAYLFLGSPSTSSVSSDTGSGASSSSTTFPTSQQATYVQITNATAQVTGNIVTCNANDGKCVITLVNAGGVDIVATGCTLNGQPGVFAPAPSNIPPDSSVNVSCAPSAGGAIPIPGFHVGGSIELSDGSSVHYMGKWV
jgi:hypothetical protein